MPPWWFKAQTISKQLQQAELNSWHLLSYSSIHAAFFCAVKSKQWKDKLGLCSDHHVAELQYISTSILSSNFPQDIRMKSTSIIFEQEHNQILTHKLTNPTTCRLIKNISTLTRRKVWWQETIIKIMALGWQVLQGSNFKATTSAYRVQC